jgi:glutaredoxin
MRQPNVTVYGTRSCPDTSRATAFLDAHQVPYEFKDLDEAPELNDYVAGLNGGKRVMPTLRIDNQILINPAEPELAEAIESATAAR